MTKISVFLLFSFLAFLLAGCIGEHDTEKYDRFMSKLDCPVVLIAKTDKASNSPAVVVRDGKGRIRTLQSSTGNGMGRCCSDLPDAVSQSREVGDTLKPCINHQQPPDR